MKYYSLNKSAPAATFREATLRGLAPDRGLYFPESVPRHEAAFFLNVATYSREEIAFTIMEPYVAGEIATSDLHRILSETVNFDIPLVPLNDTVSSLELYHGPTLAFKDVGARFMSRCLGYFVKDGDRKITVLVATSGDTGGAVANGFYGVEGVEVVILYPSGKVSRVQERQLVTLGKNIHALEVKGNFDDCQQMVKQAFLDEEINRKRFLTSANSINVARWLPQQLYYLFAWQEWKDIEHPPVVSVPSGNFGNICAGILACASGMPVQRFIAACNANKVIPDFLSSGRYEPKKAVATLSNAMDVGDPSNFVRILELFHQNLGDLRTLLESVSISDEDTRRTIKEVYEKDHYLLDPHGAVAYLALQRYLAAHPGQKGYFLETAHPVKFYEVVETVTGKKIEVPDEIAALLTKKRSSTLIEPGFQNLKAYLLDNP